MHETSSRHISGALSFASTPAQSTLSRWMHRLKQALASRLFLLTTLAALDGQVMALAAGGHLAQPVVVLTVAFTMIAGVGAFVAAVEEAELGDRAGRRQFALTATASIAVNVAAAGLGLLLAHVTTFEVIRSFAAAALVAIAWEVGGGQPLKLGGSLPVPMVLMVAGVLAEVVL